MLLITLVAISPIASAQDCQPQWSDGLHIPGFDRECKASIVHDDGSGPALILSGDFSSFGPDFGIYGVAKWDGLTMSVVGKDGPAVRVGALVSFDDGNGPDLYAGGDRLWRWDGTQWSQIGPNTTGEILDLIVFDDGSGPALYIAGDFRFWIGDTDFDNIARWDGQQWSAVGSGFDRDVNALEIFDSGAGYELYAGGRFTESGNTEVSHIAKWNGDSAWIAMGTGTDREVNALEVFDSGSGSELYVGGSFSRANGLNVRSIAKWNGTNWFGLNVQFNSSIESLAVCDLPGKGPMLYAGGQFTTMDNNPTHKIARWDGQTWSSLAEGMDGSYVKTMTTYDDGSGVRMFAGGIFHSRDVNAGFVNIAAWDGTNWSSVIEGNGVDLGGRALAAGSVGNDNEQTLFAGGEIDWAGGFSVGNIAQWNGIRWYPLDTGTNAPVNALILFDDGSGDALYAGGEFTSAGGVSTTYIARWNGIEWQPVGGGMNGNVHALFVFGDNNGDAMYAAGEFTVAGGTEANRIAKWNGEQWQPLGTGLDGSIFAITAHDEGDGLQLYVGGEFTTAGGNSAIRIARWDGATWSAIDTESVNDSVLALYSYDEGNGEGPMLFAAGLFTNAGTQFVEKISKWNGSEWRRVGSSACSECIQSINTLRVFDDGRGSQLYAGGNFNFFYAQGRFATGVVRWDGSRWSSPGNSTSTCSAVFAMVEMNWPDTAHPTLFCGGDVRCGAHEDNSQTVVANGIGAWIGCSSESTAILTGFEINKGVLIDGIIDDLISSDDSYIHTRSGFGQNFVELHSMEMIVNAITTVDNATTIDLTIESRIDEPAGLAQVKLRNWNINQFVFVGTYSLGNTDNIDTINNIDATNYVDGAGNIDLSIKHLVFVPFLAFTFESFIDQVEIMVQ